MIDMRSVFLVQILLLIVCFLILLITWVQNRKRYMGLSCWANMLVFSCVGYTLLALRDFIPDFFSIIIANMFLVIAFILFDRGVTLFYGLKRRTSFYIGVLLVYFVLVLYLVYMHPDIKLRIFLVSATFILLYGHALYLIAFKTAPKQRKISKTLIWTIVAIIFINVYRILVHIVVPTQQQGLFNQNTYDDMFFIVQVPVFLLLILSIVSLVSGSLLQEVQDEENKFNSIFNFAPYGALITRCEDSRVVEANKEALKLLEFDPQEFVGHTLIELDVWLDSELRTNLINDLKSGSVINGREISFQSKSKKIVPVLFSATLLTIGDTEYVVSTIKDISDINRLKSELEEMASHDMLTKLSNRRKFAEVSIMQLAIAARNNTKLAMVIFDIDDFKRINDDYSHEMGDQVLIGISERLLSFSRSADLVARYGGDEFTLLLTGISNREEAEAALQRLRLVFEPPICVMGYDFYIHISIGVATYPENGSGYEELIAKADKALYVAKRKGKNNIWFASE